MIEPGPISHNSPSSEPAETRPRSSPLNSPATAAAPNSTTPPASICMEVASSGRAGSGSRREAMVPEAQLTLAARMITTPTTDTAPRPPWLDPPNSPDRKPTPTAPATSPAVAIRPILVPVTTRSMRMSHNGTVASSRAASPDGTVRSATDTPPSPSPGRRSRCLAWHPGPHREREHQQPGDHVPGARHQQRRDRLDPDPD